MNVLCQESVAIAQGQQALEKGPGFLAPIERATGQRWGLVTK